MAALDIEHFYDSATSTLSYLVFDRETRDALVIDPVLDFDPASGRTSLSSVRRVAERISASNLRLHAVLETHAHADHLSGAQSLKRMFGAAVVIGEGIKQVQRVFKTVFALPEPFADDGSQFDRLVKDRERLSFGSLDVTIFATPGHTPSCVSYLIADAVFTGDTLFLEDLGTGRCDFPNGDAATLYRSIHDQLYRLPDATRVFVGHDYPPERRSPGFETTISREKATNVHLKQSTRLDDFVTLRAERDRTLGSPRLLFASLRVNIDAGRLPPSDAQGRRFLPLPLNQNRPTHDDGTDA